MHYPSDVAAGEAIGQAVARDAAATPAFQADVAAARTELAAERIWPHPVPAGLRAGCGAAQLAAALGRARELLGLSTLETRGPSARTKLNADELRLMREVPPHHGS